MHPLEALGLDREADERAVKRAYAQRLKATRPDEDPAGFQKLHEDYKAALSWLRWRADNPDAKWWEDEFDEEDEDASETEATEVAPAEAAPAMSMAEFEALIGNPRYTAQPAPTPSEPPPATPPRVERVREAGEPFRLDFDDLVRRLADVAPRHDGPGLRRLLEVETGGWPIGLKEEVGYGVADRLEDEDVLTPDRLEAIVDVFGLDDVQARVDPLALQAMRERVQHRTDLRERERRIAHLWAPDNRGELARSMADPWHGGHPAFATRIFAWLLTNPKAYEWAFFLRPVPFVNRMVTSFLRDVDGGRLEVLAKHVDKQALEFWNWAAMRREANSGIRWGVAIVGLLVALAYVTKDSPRSPSAPRPSRTVMQPEDRERLRDFSDRISRANDMELSEGLAEYQKLHKELPPPPWSPGMAEIAALVHYNRAVILGQLGRTDDAKFYYDAVDRIFERSQDRLTQRVTAMALVNLGHVIAEGGDLRGSLLPYQKVVARYGELPDEKLRVQVARALIGRGAAFRQLGEPDEARHAFDEVIRRYGDTKETELAKRVETARTSRRALDQPASPPN